MILKSLHFPFASILAIALLCVPVCILTLGNDMLHAHLEEKHKKQVLHMPFSGIDDVDMTVLVTDVVGDSQEIDKDYEALLEEELEVDAIDNEEEYFEQEKNGCRNRQIVLDISFPTFPMQKIEAFQSTGEQEVENKFPKNALAEELMKKIMPSEDCSAYSEQSVAESVNRERVFPLPLPVVSNREEQQNACVEPDIEDAPSPETGKTISCCENTEQPYGAWEASLPEMEASERSEKRTLSVEKESASSFIVPDFDDDIVIVRENGHGEEDDITISPTCISLGTDSCDQDTENSLYRLHAGDIFSLSIYGEPNTEQEVAVDDTGCVSYLSLPPLLVVNKTIPEMRHALNAHIREMFTYGLVLITPVELGENSYTIQGEVEHPGRKVFSKKTTLLAALCEAGGFCYRSSTKNFSQMADLDHAFLLRQGKPVLIDFDRLVKGDMQHDIILQNGDSIFVPGIDQRKITVVGAVKAPTRIRSLQPVSMKEALSCAGGLSSQKCRQVLILRGSLVRPSYIHYDLSRIISAHGQDILLRPGDIVYVLEKTPSSQQEALKEAVTTFCSQEIMSSPYVNN